MWTCPPGNHRACDQLWETDRLDNDKGAIGIWDKVLVKVIVTRQVICLVGGNTRWRHKITFGLCGKS
jgi:hypothetical protein